MTLNSSQQIMFIFKSLFGGSDRDQDNPKVPPPAQPQVSSDRSVNKRSAFCDVCHREVSAIITDDGRFATMIVMGDDPTRHEVSSIGSCQGCDLDICAECCGWTIDQSISSAEVIARYPSCKRCGRRLVSKTEMDFARLRTLLPRMMESPDNPSELRRIVRLLRDTNPACPPHIRRANAQLLQTLMEALDQSVPDANSGQ